MDSYLFCLSHQYMTCLAPVGRFHLYLTCLTCNWPVSPVCYPSHLYFTYLTDHRAWMPPVSPVWHEALLHGDVTLLQVDLEAPPLHQPPGGLQDLRGQHRLLFLLCFFLCVTFVRFPRIPSVHLGLLVEPVQLLHWELPAFSSCHCRRWPDSGPCRRGPACKHGWRCRWTERDCVSSDPNANYGSKRCGSHSLCCCKYYIYMYT